MKSLSTILRAGVVATAFTLLAGCDDGPRTTYHCPPDSKAQDENPDGWCIYPDDSRTPKVSIYHPGTHPRHGG